MVRWSVIVKQSYDGLMETIVQSESIESNWLKSGDWKNYEAYVAGSLERQYPGILIQCDIKLDGKISGIPRQVDILVGSTQKTAIECKYLSRKVDVKCVESFLAMMDDLDISRGLIVTARGYTPAAKARAENDDRGLDLQIITPERLSKFQSLGFPIIWRETLGVGFQPPACWVVDNELTGDPNGALVFMYPLGHCLQSATRCSSFIYANIILKENEQISLEEVAAPHQASLLEDNPSYHFSFERPSLVDANGESRVMLLRTAIGDRRAFGTEYALYVDYGNEVLLLVLNSRPWKETTELSLLYELYQASSHFTTSEILTDTELP
jgi:hypothetical protein